MAAATRRVSAGLSEGVLSAESGAHTGAEKGGEIVSVKLYCGDCLEIMKTLLPKSVDCCVTSPPYFGLRDYGHEGQIGLEPTPDEFVQKLVEVFREVKRVLRDDGTLFLNLGDSYHASRVRSCDISGKAGRGLLKRDSSSENPHGEHTGYWWSRIADIDCRRAHEQAAELFQQTLASMGELRGRPPIADSVARQQIQQCVASNLGQVRFAIRAVEQLLSFQSSMLAECVPQLQAGLTQTDTLSACLSSLQTFSACVLRYARMLGDCEEKTCDMFDISLLSEELDHHIRCTCGYCSLVFSWLNTPYVQPQHTTITAPRQLLKPKDLIGIPWRVAFALQADGWYLRQDIIWHKPNPMPESVKDRCTKAHEYIFLLSKSQRYYFDNEAIKERATGRDPGNKGHKYAQDGVYAAQRPQSRLADCGARETRNRRSVWTVATRPFKGAHFATFPLGLIEPCILAGCPKDGVVLDPFNGAGTTGLVSVQNGRNYIGIELNAEYLEMARLRIDAAEVIKNKPTEPTLFDFMLKGGDDDQ